MNNWKIDWSGKAFRYSKEEVDTVLEVMENADPLTLGKYLNQFESDFAKYNGTPNSFAVSNCTNALDLIAIMSNLKKGDVVEFLGPIGNFVINENSKKKDLPDFPSDLNPLLIGEKIYVDRNSVDKLLTTK